MEGLVFCGGAAGGQGVFFWELCWAQVGWVEVLGGDYWGGWDVGIGFGYGYEEGFLALVGVGVVRVADGVIEGFALEGAVPQPTAG